MKKYNPEKLIHNYVNETSSEKERIIVESWHQKDLKESTFIPSKEHISVVHYRTRDTLNNYIHSKEHKKNIKSLWQKLAITATIFLIGFIFLFQINNKQITSKSTKTHLVENDVQPGQNRAILTLNGGEKISLDQTNKELIAVQGGVNISKSNGLLIYNQHKYPTSTTVINKLETPRGGKYQLLLPDGTKVWLNSASTLTYPNLFKGKERVVTLTGEAYFEVTKDKEKTFKVVSKMQTIEVLGTHFNIKAYEDETETQTTLAEGKVKVSRGLQFKILAPGQAAFTRKNSKNIKTKESNIEKDLAWKNNEFIFNGDSLESIMRDVSRWYDVDVTYEGNLNKGKYWGIVSRSKNISEVLRMLQLTGKINYKIEGRRITLMH